MALAKFLITTNSVNKFDLLLTNAPLLHPLKTSKNVRFSDFFIGYRSETLDQNGLICLEIIAKHRLLYF